MPLVIKDNCLYRKIGKSVTQVSNFVVEILCYVKADEDSGFICEVTSHSGRSLGYALHCIRSIQMQVMLRMYVVANTLAKYSVR